MNPVIVIPSYWARHDYLPEVGEVGVYDHATPVDKPMPELETCLASLDKVRGVLRTVVLLVAPPECEESARARVEGICRMHPNLNPLIIGSPEARLVTDVVYGLAPTMPGEAVALRGYGAIRNMGLAVAAVLGHDVVVFLDDDEVALDENFLIDAVYGLGLSNRQGIPILAKTGHFIDREGSPYANVGSPRWSERRWSKRRAFNALMQRLLDGPRIMRTSYLCGGCFAVTAQAFTRVGFDSVITRGEDLDYLFDLRMYGIDVWFDNQWLVRHMPPEVPSHAARFLQDVYRWTYERRKLAVTNATIGMRPVTPESLMPYPAQWVSDEVDSRIATTALRRAIVGPERLEYLRIYLFGRRQARVWAEGVESRYLKFQTYWPQVMATIWDFQELAQRLVRLGTARLRASASQRGNDA